MPFFSASSALLEVGTSFAHFCTESGLPPYFNYTSDKMQLDPTSFPPLSTKRFEINIVACLQVEGKLKFLKLKRVQTVMGCGMCGDGNTMAIMLDHRSTALGRDYKG